jgi:hypothetical protein
MTMLVSALLLPYQPPLLLLRIPLIYNLFTLTD